MLAARGLQWKKIMSYVEKTTSDIVFPTSDVVLRCRHTERIAALTASRNSAPLDLLSYDCRLAVGTD